MSDKEKKRMNKEISKELGPFVDGIRTKHADYELFKQAFNDSHHGLIFGGDIALILLMQKKAESLTPSEAIGDLQELFSYLGIVEGLGNNVVNMVVMLLVANGRDLHIECRHTTPRIKHVVSIKDLEDERVALTTKLNFLRDNGITKLASIIDSELRNKIAHLDFVIRKDRIYIKGKPAFEFVSSSKDKLFSACVTVWELIIQLAKEQGWIKKRQN